MKHELLIPKEKMSATNTQHLILVDAPLETQLIALDPKKQRRANLRIWRQVLKFILAFMQGRRSDLSLESWHRLEYRNEHQSYDRSRDRVHYRFL